MTQSTSPETASGQEALPRQHRQYTIGELAKMFEVTPRTIRFYEQEGLLAPVARGRNASTTRRTGCA